MASQSEQLERETEQVRADLTQTLDELRSRISPGQVVDQMIDYTRDGDAAVLVHNLRRQVVNNPLALGLIGAGLAWLMMPKRADSGRTEVSTAVMPDRRAHTSEAIGEAGDRMRAGYRSGMESARAGMDELRETGREAGARLRETGSQIAGTAESLRQAASQRYEDLSQSAAHLSEAAAQRAVHVRESASSLGQSFMSLCREQPLILAGLGLALGAALGAGLPRTESEDRLMGEASDELKEKAEGLATEQVQHAKQAVEEAAGEVGKTAEQLAESAESAEVPSIVPPEHGGPISEHEGMREPLHGER